MSRTGEPDVLGEMEASRLTVRLKGQNHGR